MSERRQGAVFDKYLMTVISTVTCAVLVWCGSSIVELKTEVAKLAEKFAMRSELESQKMEISLIRAELQQVANEQARRTSLFPQLKK